jgi:CRP-like cAMP-binding protein
MPSSRRLRRSQFCSIKPNKMFDPKEFLANVGIGRSIQQYGPKQTIFSQGKPADAVYYFQGGRVRLSVISKQGKEATIALLGRGDFLGVSPPINPFGWKLLLQQRRVPS